MSRYDAEGVWDFFVDGLDGVKKRVCEEVKWALQKSTSHDDSEVEKLVQLPDGILGKIRKETSLNGEFTGDAVQRLAGCCRLDLGRCFQVKSLSPAEKADIVKTADSEGFIALAATGDPTWSEDDRIELFLITTALRRLDNSQGS